MTIIQVWKLSSGGSYLRVPPVYDSVSSSTTFGIIGRTMETVGNFRFEKGGPGRARSPSVQYGGHVHRARSLVENAFVSRRARLITEAVNFFLSLRNYRVLRYRRHRRLSYSQGPKLHVGDVDFSLQSKVSYWGTSKLNGVATFMSYSSLSLVLYKFVTFQTNKWFLIKYYFIQIQSKSRYILYVLYIQK